MGPRVNRIDPVPSTPERILVGRGSADQSTDARSATQRLPRAEGLPDTSRWQNGNRWLAEHLTVSLDALSAAVNSRDSAFTPLRASISVVQLMFGGCKLGMGIRVESRWFRVCVAWSCCGMFEMNLGVGMI